MKKVSRHDKTVIVDAYEITVENIQNIFYQEVTKNLTSGSVAKIGDYIITPEKTNKPYISTKEMYEKTFKDIPDKV